jgi:hypothetical protein
VKLLGTIDRQRPFGRGRPFQRPKWGLHTSLTTFGSTASVVRAHSTSIFVQNAPAAITIVALPALLIQPLQTSIKGRWWRWRLMWKYPCIITPTRPTEILLADWNQRRLIRPAHPLAFHPLLGPTKWNHLRLKKMALQHPICLFKI